jgi:PilZ domain
MGQRREPRKEIRLPVRIFGTDCHGRAFSEKVFTADISGGGAKLTGVHSEIKAGDIIGLAFEKSKGRFFVRWVGQPHTPLEGQVGLQNASSEKFIWGSPLPDPGIDQFGRQSAGGERRKHQRLRSGNSVELQPQGGSAPIWGKAADLSVGGCFVEMPIPLKQGTSLKLGLWINESKLWVKGKVVNSRPGFGIGIQFMDLSQEDVERLSQFLKSVSRVPF